MTADDRLSPADRADGPLLAPPPAHIPFFLRPALWLAKRMTGKDPLPGRLLAWFPKGAIGAGVFELAAAGPGDLDGRLLAVARIAASVACGCPFCVDMNAATWARSGLQQEELRLLLDGAQDPAALAALGPREALAAAWARALSQTPVSVPPELAAGLRERFTPRELVVLASTIAQVNFWSRFNQGLGVPSAGFCDQASCAAAPHRQSSRLPLAGSTS
jgi:AhpD family alkylhydroperoxidase